MCDLVPDPLFNRLSGIVTVWTESAGDRANASEEAGADRANASAGEVATACRILTSKRFNETNGRVTEGTAIENATAIGIARGDDRGATIAIATGTVSEISVTETAIAGTERIAAIVRTRTRRRFELRKSLWTVSLTSNGTIFSRERNVLSLSCRCRKRTFTLSLLSTRLSGLQ